MKITSLFLLIMILVNISASQGPPDTQLIACDSTSKGHLSYTNNTYDFFEFTLNAASYVKISTCGSDFDTYLVLMNSSNFDVIYENNDVFSGACGFNAVIDTDKKLDVGTYFIVIHGAEFAHYGDYFLALQCSEKGIPTIPEAIGIPVQSDCNFVSAFTSSKNGLDQGIKPLDVCSIQSIDHSRKYICNVAGDGILMISYDNNDCSGTGSVSPIEGQGETYYFNCIGSSDNCDIGTLNGDCANGQYLFSLTFVVDQCAGGNMISCNTGHIAFENYFDDNCANFRNSSIPSGCTFISECDIFPEPITTEELPESSTCCACLNPKSSGEKKCEQDQACTDIVCASDPFCCENSWDNACVSRADDICTASNGKITCGSSLTNDISSNNLADKFQFVLTTPSYVEISTCGSNFDTYLTLKNSNNITIFENDDDYSNECGVNAVINTDKLEPDTYTIIVTGYGGYAVGAYNLALQCEEGPNPTMPTATGIPVESDCNFVAFNGVAQPLDVCSIQYSFDNSQGFSIKFVCNNENDEILQINYENAYCSGDGDISTFDGWGEKYYFNCNGLSSNCNEISMTQSCGSEWYIGTFVADECVGRKMIACNNNKLALNTYFDEDCMYIRNSSYAPESDENCTFTSNPECDIFPEPITTEELPNCIQYGCGIGFECDLVSGECLRDCNVFAIDEYLLQCSNEFQSQENVVNNLQTKINDLELQLLTVKQIVDALRVQKKEKKENKSETVPFILFTGDNYLKDMLVVLLCIINVLVVMYLCYDKRTKGGKGYVDVQRYIDEEEVSLQN